MIREDLVACLTQIQALAGECLAELQNWDRTSDKAAERVRIKKPISRRTLPKRILELRNGGFFSVPRTAREVQENLHSSYPCEVDRIAMALLRLKRKELRKASKIIDGKRQVAYVW
jgi:transcription initiation factor IIE alpha subunit